MPVTSPFVLYVNNTAYDVRKVSSYVTDSVNYPNKALVRFIDEPKTVVIFDLSTFETAYQAALNSVSTFANGFSDTSFGNTGGTFTPAAGGTVAIGTVGNNVSMVLVLPSGAIATGNLTAPSAPPNGLELTVALGPTNLITTFNFQANTGQTVLAGSVAGALNTSFSWLYRASNTTWYRLK